MSYQAVIFDLGGVVFPSPFEAFDAYDHGNGLAKGTLRALIRRSSEEGAWAALERGELTMDEFVIALETEADAEGFALDARKLMALIGSSLGPRPEMVRAIRQHPRAGTAHGRAHQQLGRRRQPHDTERAPRHARVRRDRRVGARNGCANPTRASTRSTIARLNVLASEAIFLDDLGMNLKPAREMGMATIKVADPDVALGGARGAARVPGPMTQVR